MQLMLQDFRPHEASRLEMLRDSLWWGIRTTNLEPAPIAIEGDAGSRGSMPSAGRGAACYGDRRSPGGVVDTSAPNSRLRLASVGQQVRGRDDSGSCGGTGSGGRPPACCRGCRQHGGVRWGRGRLPHRCHRRRQIKRGVRLEGSPVGKAERAVGPLHLGMAAHGDSGT